jgi:hypothetical protein
MLEEELQQVIAEIAKLETKRMQLIVRLVLEELHGGDPQRIGQETSPLGSRRHIAAVKRRIQAEQAAGQVPGTRGAFIVGRKHLLTRDALAQELGRATPKTAVHASKRAEETDDDLEERLLQGWKEGRSAT